MACIKTNWKNNNNNLKKASAIGMDWYYNFSIIINFHAIIGNKKIIIIVSNAESGKKSLAIWMHQYKNFSQYDN